MKKFKVTYMEVVKYEFELEGESIEDIQENVYEKMDNVFDPQDGLLIDSYVENIEEV